MAQILHTLKASRLRTTWDGSSNKVCHQTAKHTLIANTGNSNRATHKWMHGHYWQHIKSCHRPIPRYHRWHSTTYRLATIPHDWHSIVHYDSSRSSKVSDLSVIWKSICDFLLAINSNLGPISHRLATIYPRQTGHRQTAMTTMPIARPLLKYDWLKTVTRQLTVISSKAVNGAGSQIPITRYHDQLKLNSTSLGFSMYAKLMHTFYSSIIWNAFATYIVQHLHTISRYRNAGRN